MMILTHPLKRWQCSTVNLHFILIYHWITKLFVIDWFSWNLLWLTLYRLDYWGFCREFSKNLPLYVVFTTNITRFLLSVKKMLPNILMCHDNDRKRIFKKFSAIIVLMVNRSFHHWRICGKPTINITSHRDVRAALYVKETSKQKKKARWQTLIRLKLMEKKKS